MKSKIAVIRGTKTLKAAFSGLLFVLVFGCGAFAQKTKTPQPVPSPKKTSPVNLPKVTQIDEAGLKNALKTNGKPLLVNFWATWCDPCREEFPDLVKIDMDYKGKIDFITISLDFPEEIKTTVPQFLSEMKAEMPAFLLKVADENAVISSISKDWAGGMPFTILYNEKGEIAFFTQGKVKMDILRAEIDKITQKTNTLPTTNSVLLTNGLFESREDYEQGKIDAQTDISKGILIIHTGGRGNSSSRFFAALLKQRYGIETKGRGCLLTPQAVSYDTGYNEISKAEIKRKFGDEILDKTRNEAEKLASQPMADVMELKLTVNQQP